MGIISLVELRKKNPQLVVDDDKRQEETVHVIHFYS